MRLQIANPFPTGGADAPEPVTAVLHMVARSQRWVLDGGPRNQFGFWDRDPEAPNLLFWPEPAPPVSGTVERHVRTIELYDGAGRLLDVSGEVTAEDEPWGTAEVLEAHSDRFTRCDEPPVAPPAGIDDTIVYEEIPEIPGVPGAEPAP